MEQEQQTFVQMSYCQFDKSEAIIRQDEESDPLETKKPVNMKTLEQDPDSRDYITARPKFILYWHELVRGTKTMELRNRSEMSKALLSTDLSPSTSLRQSCLFPDW